ncbi:hypothetical protein EJD97_004200 [Solanum chilense]|uniref:Uncharacterized protein n=1 Tax=Solanum chilense TaxID=4083 RepID=A0A6N2BT61_SOLCI|nr:hypothetical protein EJD97_004200 [Solanum chilense]
MPPHNLIHVEFHIILWPVSRLHRDKVGRFRNPVHNNPYGVMLPLSPRKNNHEVHVNGLPLPSRNLNDLSETTKLKVLRLNLVTIRTLCHILKNVLLQAILPIGLLELMKHLGGTWTYRIYRTMGLYNNLRPQIIHVWYTQPVLVP